MVRRVEAVELAFQAGEPFALADLAVLDSGEASGQVQQQAGEGESDDEDRSDAGIR